MQQTLEHSGWQSARMAGIFRYHWKALGKTVGWVLLILLGAQLLSLIFPLLSDTPYPYEGVYADLSVTFLLSLICGCVAANQSTRFLLRFGTSRFGVWLGNLLSLFAGMVAFLLGTLLLSMLMGGITALLANVMPQKFAFSRNLGDAQGTGLFVDSLVTAIKTLPRYILYTVEWTALFYLLGCCLRRNLGVTIAVIVGVPMLVMILTLIPAVREAARTVESANDREMMLLGVQWMKYIMDAANFIEHQWPMIQLGGALVSLPLSYLCMRNTPQP